MDAIEKWEVHDWSLLSKTPNVRAARRARRGSAPRSNSKFVTTANAALKLANQMVPTVDLRPVLALAAPPPRAVDEKTQLQLLAAELEALRKHVQSLELRLTAVQGPPAGLGSGEVPAHLVQPVERASAILRKHFGAEVSVNVEPHVDGSAVRYFAVAQVALDPADALRVLDAASEEWIGEPNSVLRQVGIDVELV